MFCINVPNISESHFPLLKVEIIIPTSKGYYKGFKLNESENDKETKGISLDSYFSKRSVWLAGYPVLKELPA